jgi:hypothetical protein
MFRSPDRGESFLDTCEIGSTKCDFEYEDHRWMRIAEDVERHCVGALAQAESRHHIERAEVQRNRQTLAEEPSKLSGV